MNLLNHTPFVATTTLWEDRQGQPNLTVLVKGTFMIRGREVSPADTQLPVLITDEHYGKDPLASVRLESDIVPFKPRADVVLVGQAYAPQLRPVRWLDVSLRLGKLRKAIRVFGDRTWCFPSRLALFPKISRPEPFVRMNVVYERAFGGVYDGPGFYCEENLVGTGYIRKKRKKSIHKKRLPNLEDPEHLIRRWRSKPKPAGFGFYGRGWTPRLKYAGTYDDKYQKERAPALPLDFSYDFYNGAHPDLQVEGYLRGDEEVELVNLSPESRLCFRLPGIRPSVAVSRWTTQPEWWMDENADEDREVVFEDIPTAEESVSVNLDTLVLIPDEGIFYEVFRGVCSLKSLDEPEIAQIKITV